MANEHDDFELADYGSPAWLGQPDLREKIRKMEEEAGSGEGPWLDGSPEGDLLWKFMEKPWWQPAWLFWWLNRSHFQEPTASGEGQSG